MKNVKLLLIIAALFSASLGLQAHKIKVHPRHGTVVTTIHHSKIVVHKGTNFYYAKGVWYKPYGRKYVVCRAPLGIRVRYIPRGYRIVRLNGRKYYTHNGIWYTKKRGYYTVVRVS